VSGALLPLVTAVLDRWGTRYALIGAAAVAAHGVARSTFFARLLLAALVQRSGPRLVYTPCP